MLLSIPLMLLLLVFLLLLLFLFFLIIEVYRLHLPVMKITDLDASTDIGIRSVTPPQTFQTMLALQAATCEIYDQDLIAAINTVYSSSGYGTTVDKIGIRYSGTPDKYESDFGTGVGFYCDARSDPDNTNTPCAGFIKTLTVPETLKDGQDTNGFYFSYIQLCDPGQTMNVFVHTTSATYKLGLGLGLGLGVVWVRDTIEYILMHSMLC
jgi:hypothetical protein